MKYKSNKTITQKLILSIICIMLIINFTIPNYSHAGDITNSLFKPIKGLICGIADTAMYLIQWCFIGKTDQFEEVPSGNKDRWGSILWVAENKIEWPTFKITPEEIFKGDVPALNVNFLKPIKKYDELSSEEQGMTKENTQDALINLRNTISSWYMALRNISIIGLLSILVYVGIRMMLCSVASEKAKYKQMLLDWVVALCLIFFLHYIMSFTMTVVEQITNIFSTEGTTQIQLMSVDQNINGGTVNNLMEYARVYVNLADAMQSLTFLIVYVWLVVYTVKFIITYIKRFIHMAFLTMIAPLVALTYPLDKISDGKAQAFDMWLKDYIFNALIQPFHLIIYTVFVGAAMNLAVSNMIYACVAIGFISQAEKFMRKMFGFDKAPNASGGLGSFAGGALAGNLLSKATSAIGKGANGGKEKPGADAPKPPKQKIENPYGNGENKDNNSVKSGEDTNLPEGKGEGADANPVNDFSGANTDDGQNDDLSSPEMQAQLEAGDEDGAETKSADGGAPELDEGNGTGGAGTGGAGTDGAGTGEGGKRQGRSTSDNSNNKRNIKHPKLETAKKYGRVLTKHGGKLIKPALKGGLGAVGALAGGIGALATGGDISKGIMTGAGVGAAIGSATGNLPGAISNTARNVKGGLQDFKADWKSVQNKDDADKYRYEKQFMNNKAKQDYVRKYFANSEGGALSGKELKEKMNQLYNYEMAGITDIDTQKELMAMEDEKIKNGATVDNARQQVLYANEMASKIDKKQLMEKYDTVRENQIAQLMENGNYTEQQATHVVDSALKDVGKIKGVSISNIQAQNEKKKAQQKIADQEAAAKAKQAAEDRELQNRFYKEMLK